MASDELDASSHPLPSERSLSGSGPSVTGSGTTSRLGGAGANSNGSSSSINLPLDEQIHDALSKLDLEIKVKDGAENLLQLLQNDPDAADKHSLRAQVEAERQNANQRIALLQQTVDDLQLRARFFLPPAAFGAAGPGAGQTLGLTHGPGLASPPSTSGSSLSFDPLHGPHHTPHQSSQHQQPSSSPSASASTSGLGIVGIHPSTTSSSPSGRSGNGVNLGGDDVADRDQQQEDVHQAEEKTREKTRMAKTQAEALLAMLTSLSHIDTDQPEAGAAGSSATAGAAGDSSSSSNIANTSTSQTGATPPHVQRRGRNAPGGGHIRTPSNAAGLGQKAKQRMDTLSRLAGVLRSSVRVRYELTPSTFAKALLPCLSDSAGKEVRAHAYRTLRYAIHRNPQALCQALNRRGMALYLVRTFLRDRRFEQEREQALKFVRAIVDAAARDAGPASGSGPGGFGNGSGPEGPRDGGGGSGSGGAKQGNVALCMPVGTVRALSAMAEQSDDELRMLSIETLAEMALVDFPYVAQAGGLGAIIHALSDASSELAPSLMRIVLALLDRPDTRSYLRPGIDLESVIAGFTDPPFHGFATTEAGLRATARVVSVMLRSWTGLTYLCMADLRAIRSLVQAVQINPNDACDVLLDMLYDLFSLDAKVAAGATGAGGAEDVGDALAAFQFRQADLSGSSGGSGAKASSAGSTKRAPYNLLDHYLALVLSVFLEAGLLEALVHVIEHYSESRRKATLLIGEVLHLTNRLLPHHVGTRIHALPRLFALASAKSTAAGKTRDAASSALTLIDLINRNKSEAAALTPRGASGTGSSSSTGVGAGPGSGPSERRAMDKSKQRSLTLMDDASFRNMMLETQILANKDHTKWNMEVLVDLLEGALLVPKRLEEAMKVSRFMRRFLAFYHPFALRYSSIRRSRSNTTYTRLACTALKLILAHPEGVRFLQEDALLPQIGDCLLQMDEYSSKATDEPLMTRARLEETLTSGYFDMLHVLSQSAEGLELLEKWQVFTILHRLVVQHRKDYLLKAVLQHLDMQDDGHPRVLLTHALTAGSRELRLFATYHVASVVTSNPTSETMVDLLVMQLYDASRQVREAAVRLVTQLCERADVLDRVVAKRPSLDHLGELGQTLLLRFLSTHHGLQQLSEGGYVTRSMEDWYAERNARYCVQIEVWLAVALSIYRIRAARGAHFDGTAPPHFYGELVKTQLGCRMLQESGHLDEFAQFILQHRHEERDTEILGRLKSCLWAVGHVATSEGGLHLLEAHDLVALLVEMAEEASVISVKGTCFFVLGLVGTTEAGADLLHDYGWLSPRSAFESGACLPVDLRSFVAMPKWTPIAAYVDLQYLKLRPSRSAVQSEIWQSLANLGNSITANNASKTLAKLKARHPNHFRDRTLRARAVALLNQFHFKQAVRRYIWDLFELRLDDAEVIALSDTMNDILTAEPPDADASAPVLAPVRGGGFSLQNLDNDGESSVGSLPVHRLGPPRPEFAGPAPNLTPRTRVVGFVG